MYSKRVFTPFRIHFSDFLFPSVITAAGAGGLPAMENVMRSGIISSITTYIAIGEYIINNHEVVE